MERKDIEKLLSPYSTVAVIGAQYGDEGKGKIVDLLAAKWANVVARGTGGANAGHSIHVGKAEHVFHLLPSGILRDNEGVMTICGKGMAICPRVLIEELDLLSKLGYSTGKLRISHKATLVLPQHIILDKLTELEAGLGKIGTTGRGIGPAYTDRVARNGLVLNDLLNPTTLRCKLLINLEEKARRFRGSTVPPSQIESMIEELTPLFGCSLYDRQTFFNLEKLLAVYLEYGRRLASRIADTDALLQKKVIEKKKVLLEGAQGILLSVNHGAHPHVTSSDCTPSGLAVGVGLKERNIDATILVAKWPYMTRVGAGPFPTELGCCSAAFCNSPGACKEMELTKHGKPNINSSDPSEQEVAIRLAGNEYGATTGRPRRVGWFDLPLLTYAIKAASGDVILALTKADVLDECERLRLCVGYSYLGEEIQTAGVTIKSRDKLDEVVMDQAVLDYCTPLYREYPGWCAPLGRLTDQRELPKVLQTLIDELTSLSKCKVGILSVGPDREQTILLD